MDNRNLNLKFWNSRLIDWWHNRHTSFIIMEWSKFWTRVIQGRPHHSGYRILTREYSLCSGLVARSLVYNAGRLTASEIFVLIRLMQSPPFAALYHNSTRIKGPSKMLQHTCRPSWCMSWICLSIFNEASEQNSSLCLVRSPTAGSSSCTINYDDFEIGLMLKTLGIRSGIMTCTQYPKAWMVVDQSIIIFNDQS